MLENLVDGLLLAAVIVVYGLYLWSLDRDCSETLSDEDQRELNL